MAKPIRGDDPFNILDLDDIPKPGRDIPARPAPRPHSPNLLEEDEVPSRTGKGEEKKSAAPRRTAGQGQEADRNGREASNMGKKEPKRKKNGKKKMKLWLKILIPVLVVLGIAGGTAAYVLMDIAGSYDPVELNEAELGFDSVIDKNVKNIALFGVDSRNGLLDKGTRSDSIIILSIDKNHNKVKLSSIMRDAYVNIPGRGMDKITHAYAFGGAELAVRTLNENFDLDITDFATVDFANMAEIVDAVGGVTIDVKDNELNNLNECIRSLAMETGTTADPVKSSGTQVLNGVQAVGYSRIRYVGNGDFERTERQRTVLMQLFNKALSMNPTKYPQLAKDLLGLTKTSLDSGTLMGYAPLALQKPTMVTTRFPTDSDYKGEKINGIYYMTFNDAVTTQKLHDFIYNDIMPS